MPSRSPGAALIILRMRNALLLSAALVAAPARAQIMIDGAAARNLADSIKRFRERLAPAPVDHEAVDTLFNRLADDPEGAFVRQGRPDAQGVFENLAVLLVEVPAPAPPPSEGIEIKDLVYRRYFSHIVGRAEKWTPLPKGEFQVDVWDYQIGLDGTILSVEHAVLVGKPGADLSLFAADPKRSGGFKMSPKDPAVLKRWKTMSEQFLTMGPTFPA